MPFRGVSGGGGGYIQHACSFSIKPVRTMAIAIIELLNYTINTANDIVKEDLEQLFIHNTFVSKF